MLKTWDTRMTFHNHSRFAVTSAAHNPSCHAPAPRRIRLAVQFGALGDPEFIPIHPFPPTSHRKPRLREIVIHFPSRIGQHRPVRWLFLFLFCCVLAALAANAQPTNSPTTISNAPTTIIEVAGQVE